MIRIERGQEPPALTTMRQQELPKLRKIIGNGNQPESKDFLRCDEARDTLRERQHYKCCYCERRITTEFNDLEHFRPKARSDRTPGCTETYGYWWLAYTWNNLLFACCNCNRSGKKDRFPLINGCSPLTPEDDPPGGELPLLLDPASSINPVEHIVFTPVSFNTSHIRRWPAMARGGSTLGDQTIEVCGLNHDGLLELRTKTVEDGEIKRRVDAINDAINGNYIRWIEHEFKAALKMFKPDQEYVHLSYDAFCYLVPNAKLAPYGLRWPEPSAIPL